MKKALLVLGIISVMPLCAHAYIYEDETSDMRTLKVQGYSTATMEVVDWAKYNNGAGHTKYVRYFKPKHNGTLGRAYQSLKTYVDPIQDDGSFGNHNIQFSNTWKGNETKYSSDLEASGRIERL